MHGGRVLMIAHHFPPAGGSGSNRALAFARYLPEYGWRPIVVTPGTAWAAERDAGLLASVPPYVAVLRTRSLEPRPRPRPGPRSRDTSQGDNRAAADSRLRSHLGHLKRFPDAHVGWLPFALATARRTRYDVAYSSSGPFTSHVVGLLLKRLTGRPWVAELRDGWYCWNRAIFPDYPAWRDPLERRLESAALRSADRVVLVTDRMADQFRRQYSDLSRDHFAVVSNGFDPLQIGPSVTDPHLGWEVLHAGALYYGRSLGAFLEAARRIAKADSEFAREFRLVLVGTLDGSARADIQRSGLGDKIAILGQRDHATTLRAMHSADALLLVANTTTSAEATVPGKLFEYLAIGRPVLAIAPPESSTADVLEQTGGGWLAPAGDPAAIACVLALAFRERSRKADPEQVARYDRRALTCDLARVFDLVRSGAPRRL
jgi:glycosyltransferase involved in cell wall biosynthesis